MVANSLAYNICTVTPCATLEIMADQIPRDLMEHYNLSEECCNREITDIHISDFCLSGCTKWRLMAPNLGLTESDVSDIKHDSLNEEEMRPNFLFKWRNKKGRDATYTALINALLKLGCRKDAELVCQLLQQSIATPTQPSFVSTANLRPPPSNLSTTCLQPKSASTGAQTTCVSTSHLQTQSVSSYSHPASASLPITNLNTPNDTESTTEKGR